MISSDRYSSETSEVRRFKFSNLLSILGESIGSIDLGSLPVEKHADGYLGSGSLNVPS